MDSKKIGLFIAECRNNINRTQYELSKALGIPKKNIIDWENGYCLPNISQFNDICSELNISMTELLMGKKIENDVAKTEMNNMTRELVDLCNKKIKNNIRTNIVISSILVILFSMILISIVL